MDKKPRLVTKKQGYEYWMQLEDKEGGLVWIKYKGKKIAEGDYDYDAGHHWFNVPWNKGQKGYDSGADVLADFIKRKVTEPLKEGTEMDKENTEQIQENDTPDYTQHRALINHAMKGEPAQMSQIFSNIMSDKIAGAIQDRRVEIGQNLFTGASQKQD